MTFETPELSIVLYGDLAAASVGISMEVEGFPAFSLGEFTAYTLDEGECMPIPGLSIGIMGFGAGLFACASIQDLSIGNNGISGQLTLHLTAMVDVVFDQYGYDLLSHPVASFEMGSSSSPSSGNTNSPSSSGGSDQATCPTACERITVGSVQTCEYDCVRCNLQVCDEWYEKRSNIQNDIDNSSEKELDVAIIGGVAAATVLLIVVIAVSMWCCCCKNKKQVIGVPQPTIVFQTQAPAQ